MSMKNERWRAENPYHALKREEKSYNAKARKEITRAYEQEIRKVLNELKN